MGCKGSRVRIPPPRPKLVLKINGLAPFRANPFFVCVDRHARSSAQIPLQTPAAEYCGSAMQLLMRLSGIAGLPASRCLPRGRDSALRGRTAQSLLTPRQQEDAMLLSNLLHSETVCERVGLVGRSAAFRTMIDALLRYAAVDVTVLLEGATGTGKELAARALHYLGTRASGPFVPVDCGALPESLFEDELFGHA